MLWIMSLLILSFTTPALSSDNLCLNSDEGFKFDPLTIDNVDCSYYLHREIDQTCGPSGYYVDFGYKFCSKFMFAKRHWLDFSPKAYTWLTNVGLCLQKQLHQERCESLAADKESLSCKAVESYAMKSHPECYLMPDINRPHISICNLAPTDYLVLTKVIKKTFLKKSIWSQMRLTIKGCGARIFKYLN